MYVVRPGSVLAQTAAEVLGRHVAGADGTCVTCARMSPCPTAAYAQSVTEAVEPADDLSAHAPLAAAA